MKIRHLSIVGALTVGLAAPLAAQTDMSKPQPPGAAMSEEKFIKDTAANGMVEVEIAKMAAEKATRPEVKEFAQMLADDHSKVNEELKSLASQKNVALPEEPRPEQKAEKERLSKLSGAEFDAAFTKAMVQSHKKSVTNFGKESTAAKDPDIKAFASKTLPKLKEHLEKAEQLAGEKGKSGTEHKH
jgi:putative membrane protein